MPKMKAVANIQNLRSEKGKSIIVRNLHRILDICIIDIDTDNGLLCFLYPSPPSFKKVREELERIGFPMVSCKFPKPPVETYGDNDLTFPMI